MSFCFVSLCRVQCLSAGEWGMANVGQSLINCLKGRRFVSLPGFSQMLGWTLQVVKWQGDTAVTATFTNDTRSDATSPAEGSEAARLLPPLRTHRRRERPAVFVAMAAKVERSRLSALGAHKLSHRRHTLTALWWRRSDCHLEMTQLLCCTLSIRFALSNTLRPASRHFISSRINNNNNNNINRGKKMKRRKCS